MTARVRVLVVGGGGREHALAWKLAQSPRVDRVYVAPGNPGTAAEPKCENLSIASEDLDALSAFARTRAIDLTVVGPEAPLAAGIVDRFQAEGLAIFGPTRANARLEASKAFAKAFFARHGIPTAAFAVFEALEPAVAHVRARGAPIVIKADGLAAGKGVVVAEDLAAAEAALHECFSGAFGSAGQRVVVEEFLDGEEASLIVLAAGTDYLVLPTAQDHKRAYDGDRGPNTGGMGVYSPAPILDAERIQRCCRTIIEPTLTALAQAGTPYTGFLYAGLMIDRQGRAKVLEYNCRLGDPETQVLMPRIASDLLTHIEAALAGRLGTERIELDRRAAIGVVLAAEGYPGRVRKGDPITGLDAVPAEVKVFHAGTRRQGEAIVTDGGRVLCVSALGDDLAAAQRLAYAAAAGITWPGCFYRRDIGWRALAGRASA